MQVKSVRAYAYTLLWPYLGLIYAIYNWKQPYAKNVLWLFCVYFGFTFVVSSEGLDSAVYTYALEHLHTNFDSTSFYEYVIGKGGNDFLNSILTYIVAIFTGDKRVLLGIYGFVFGYFYSRNVAFVLNKIGGKTNRYNILFLLLVIFMNPFWNINGFRFYTSTNILIFGLFLRTQGKYALSGLFCILAVLMHFSFLLPVTLLGLYKFIPKHRFAILAILWISYFFTIDVTWVIEHVPILTNSLDAKIAAYTHEQYVAYIVDTRNNASWFILKRMEWLTLIYTLLGTNLVIFHARHIKNHKWLIFFYLGIFVMCMGEILYSIPSMERLITLGQLICTFFFVEYFKNFSPRHFLETPFHYIIYIPILIYIIVEIRLGCEYIGVASFVHNFFTLWWVDFQTTATNVYELIF